MNATKAHIESLEVLSIAGQVAGIVRRVIDDPAYRVFLFGSWAAGTARERSDIDIGIQGPSSVSPAAITEIREACDMLPTLYSVDVVDFSRLPPSFRESAESTILELEPS